MTPEHYIIIILIAIASFLAGIGVSHVKVAGKVDVHEAKIAGLEKDFEGERKRTDERIYAVIGLVEKAIEHNGKVIEQNTKIIAKMEMAA